MGNKNAVHVRILETVPWIGGVVCFIHTAAGNNKQSKRAMEVNFISTCTTGVIG